jgi:hypothetical protein
MVRVIASMKEGNMPDERRDFNRFDVSLDVSFKPTKGSDEYFAGVTKNFSRKGLCFESESFDLELNSPMELKVKLPDQDTFVPVMGKVAWKRPVEDKYLVGIEVKEIDMEAKSRILNHAYDIWVEKNRVTQSIEE